VTDVAAKLDRALSSTVVVEAAEAAVQVTHKMRHWATTSFGTITQLPMESRNVLALLTLQPKYSGRNCGRGERSVERYIDGVDINDAETSDVSKPVLR